MGRPLLATPEVVRVVKAEYLRASERGETQKLAESLGVSLSLLRVLARRLKVVIKINAGQPRGTVTSKHLEHGYVVLHLAQIGDIPEHRYVMGQTLGRKLRKGEVVHHIDGNKRNNKPKNLMLFKNESDHQKWHVEHPDVGGFNPRRHSRLDTRGRLRCGKCRKYKTKENFGKSNTKYGYYGQCRECIKILCKLRYLKRKGQNI